MFDNKEWDIILVDPPWRFVAWSPVTGQGRSPERHYKTMDIAEIGRLPILDLAADNCALFLWSIWPRIFDAQRLVDLWNQGEINPKRQFTYRTLAWEWLKLVPSFRERIKDLFTTREHQISLLYRLFHFGMGYYLRANPEPCLLFVRGTMPVAVHNERNILIAPVQEHSRKPDDQYGKIERLYPTHQRRLELFARRSYSGWDVWGNEIESTIKL